MSRVVPNVLTIAGSDPSGGAGIQADLKTFAALQRHGMAVVTALTAQNTRGVAATHAAPADFVAAQIDAIFADIDVAAVKIGMLANRAVAEAVADRLAFHAPPFIVLDPVLVATSGDSLAATGVVNAIRDTLFPLATLITPNIPEAATLAGLPPARDAPEMRAAAVALLARGARAVLVKGGHLAGDESFDVLVMGSGERVFTAPRVATRNTHGTGCTLSSAIAAHLAGGLPLADAIAAAKDYLTGALRASDALSVGHGPGPVHHFWELWQDDKPVSDRSTPGSRQ